MVSFSLLHKLSHQNCLWKLNGCFILLLLSYSPLPSPIGVKIINQLMPNLQIFSLFLQLPLCPPIIIHLLIQILFSVCFQVSLYFFCPVLQWQNFLVVLLAGSSMCALYSTTNMYIVWYWPKQLKWNKKCCFIQTVRYLSFFWLTHSPIYKLGVTATHQRSYGATFYGKTFFP